jgi:hypothetical protein
MNNLPFVFRGARSYGGTNDSRARDLLTGEDPLPAKLEMKEGCLILARDTRVTRMAPETTDDV